MGQFTRGNGIKIRNVVKDVYYTLTRAMFTWATSKMASEAAVADSLTPLIRLFTMENGTKIAVRVKARF